MKELKSNERIVLEYEQDFKIIQKKFRSFKAYNNYLFNNPVYMCSSYKEVLKC